MSRHDGVHDDRGGRGGFGRLGGDWQGVRPSFDNPMSWAVGLGRISGIHVRIHVLFLLFVVIELGRSLGRPAEGSGAPFDFGWTAVICGCFFAVVLLHEFGHCIACRLRRGEADEILMWPLGGLASCRPRHRWRDHLVTAIGGPLVNVALFVLLAPTLGLITGRWWGLAIPNPLDIGAGWWETAGSVPLGTLYLLNWVSVLLLIFNLLPLFPLDGGRILQAILWPRIGYGDAMRWAVRIGYVGAIAMGLLGWILTNLSLVFIAVFGGLTCYATMRQLAFTDDFMGFESDEAYAADGESGETGRESGRQRRAAQRAAREEARRVAEDEAVDRILAKIRTAGMESLSSAERRLLKRATHRRRDGEGDGGVKG